MYRATGKHTDWRFIDYKPAITEHLPISLPAYLSEGQSVLDIGCNTGATALYLARRGFKVTGIDINCEAVNTAKRRAAEASLTRLCKFKCCDILENQNLGRFGALLMIRVLTCFPSYIDWKQLLTQAYSMLEESGIIYINDFRYVNNSPVYQKRYDDGMRAGLRKGNFHVNDSAGNLHFIAHHHSDDEIREMAAPYQQIEFNLKRSLSMNGNECQMFEFVGRKVAVTQLN
jgi:2-polyprenyl-3-methyl-5-hydroxy-6-metoxy-1,4-benzoquinol methylase